MAKGYWIVHLSVDDAEAYRPYVEKAPEVLAALGGRYLARGGQSETREGDMPHGRHVILEPMRSDHVDELAAATGGERSSFTYTRVPDGLHETAEYVDRLLRDAAEGAVDLRVLEAAYRSMCTGQRQAL